MSHPDLNALMLFYETVNARSISQAGKNLGVPKATISRKLRELEQQLGAVLLRRGARALTLTEFGESLYGHCEKIAAETRELSAAAAGLRSNVGGKLRVCMPLGFGSALISEVIARFALLYPQVELSVDIATGWVDVSKAPFDVAIHVGGVYNHDLPCCQLALFERAVYAAPAYLARKGTPQTPSQLHQHDCLVVSSQREAGIWQIPTPTQPERRIPITPRLQLWDASVALDMAIAGLGITILPVAMCEAAVARGQLTRILPDWSLPRCPAVATYLERRHLPTSLRAFLDMLRERFSDFG